MVKQVYENMVKTVRAFPLEIIEVVLAFVLLIMALYTAIPAEWVGVPSVYPLYVGKLAGAVVMGIPALTILFQRSRGIENYVEKTKSRKRALLGMAMMFVYIAVLRVIVIAWFPPIFVLYLGMGVIAAVCYLRLGVK